MKMWTRFVNWLVSSNPHIKTILTIVGSFLVACVIFRFPIILVFTVFGVTGAFVYGSIFTLYGGLD